LRIYLIFVLTLCSSALFAAPDWFLNPTNFFNQNEFLAGVGDGNSYEVAIEKAQLQLVNQISVRVRAETEVISIATEVESQAYFIEYIYQNVRTTSEHQLVGMEILRQVQDGDAYYVMVGLNRSRMLRNLSNECDRLSASIRSNLASAESYREDGNIVFALDSYAKATDGITQLILKKNFHDSFASRAYQITGIMTANQIESRVRELISGIHFEVVSGNQQSTLAGALLPEPVVFKATQIRSGLPRRNLVNLPVKIIYGDGTEIKTGMTDRHGEYAVYAHAIPYPADRGRIVIQIDSHKFPGFYNRILRNRTAEAHFKVTETAPLPVVLSVVDSTGRPIPSAHAQLSRILTMNNVIPRQRAPLYLKATIFQRDYKLVEGMAAPNHLVSLGMDMVFGIHETGESLGMLRGSGTGMSNRSVSDALSLAYQNVSISPRELALMLSRARDKVDTILIQDSLENLQRAKRLILAGDTTGALSALLLVTHGQENVNEAYRLIREIREQNR
jgi:hypothetical protein